MDEYTMYGAESKRYYWIKLRDSFFESDEIKLVLSQENGAKYTIFWQKLLLKAIKKQEIGILRYQENLPYSPDILSTITDTDIDTVRSALTLFEKLRMIEVMENGDIWIAAAIGLVGSETDAAGRMRKLREKRKKLISDERNNVTESYVEKEIEKEIEKEKEKEKKPLLSQLKKDADKACEENIQGLKDVVK